MTVVRAAVCTMFVIGGLALGQRARAETEIGNGGDALLCGSSDLNRTVESFDAFEARVLLQLDPDFGTANDPAVMVGYALQRLSRLDKVRADRLAGWAKTFLSEARLIPNANLQDVPDTDPTVIPNGCSLKQLAIQYRDPAPHMPRYLIDKDLWERLTNVSKAYLMLHEVIYRETIARGALDSRTARNFTGHVASSITADLSVDNYADLLADTNLPYVVRIAGMDFLRDSVTPYTSGAPHKATIAGSGIDQNDYQLSGKTFHFAAGADVTFYESGLVHGGGPAHITVVAEGAPFLVADAAKFTVAEAGGPWSLLAGSQVFVSAVGACKGTFSYLWSPLNVEANGVIADAGDLHLSFAVGSDDECIEGLGRPVTGTHAGFYPDRRLQRITLYENAKLFDAQGIEQSYNSGTKLTFDEDGRVQSSN